MGKIKVFFIVLGTLLLGALVAGIFFLWPFLAKFWNEMVVPNKAIFTSGGFALVMLWLATRKWPLWLKLILGTAALSGASTISGIELVDLSGQIFYQATLAVFLVISFAVMLWRKSRRNFKADETEEKKVRKPIGQAIKEKWDTTIVKIAGNDKNGGKKIALYTILAIVAGIVLFPLITGLVIPIWKLIIVPGRDYVLLGILIIAITVMTVFIKNIGLKTAIFGLLLSGAAIILGTDVPTLIKDTWIQISGAYFIASVLFALPFWGDGEDGDETDIRMKIASIIAWGIMIGLSIWLLEFSEVAGILLIVFGGIAGLVGFILYCTYELDDYGYIIFHGFYCVAFVSLLAINLLLSDRNTEIIAFRPTNAPVEAIVKNEAKIAPVAIAEEYSRIQETTKKNNVKEVFNIERTDVMILGVVITLKGAIVIQKNAAGDCTISVQDIVSEDDVPIKNSILKEPLVIYTNGGKLTIPIGARVEKGFNTYFYFKVPLQVCN